MTTGFGVHRGGGALLLAGITVRHPAPGGSASAASGAAAAMIGRRVDLAAERIAIERYHWSKSEFGMATARFELRNGNDFAVKDIALRCAFYGLSGTRIGSVGHTVYRRLAAGGRLRLREVPLGLVDRQAASSDCAVERAVPLGGTN